MKLIAGIDIGNSTTEACIGQAEDNGRIKFLASASRTTTGTKGTMDNIAGICAVLEEATGKLNKKPSDISLIRINEAAPVIGDTAMETITETIITDSSMIGHNPSTPAGAGQAVGEIIYAEHLLQGLPGRPYIVAVPGRWSYEEIAEMIEDCSKKMDIVGMILQEDEAVLVENRITSKIPIIDEVRDIWKVPEGKTAAIEVALPGESIRMLSNPYGIATLLELDAEQTRSVTPIAKSLIGKRSAVVIKTPHGNVTEHILPAGEIYFTDQEQKTVPVSIDAGAVKIMQLLEETDPVSDISGQPLTNVGNMLSGIKENMAALTQDSKDSVKITDILAVDTMAPVMIAGALAGETGMEKAVGIAAMVKTRQLPMERIAAGMADRIQVPVKVAGVEAVMAALGAITTPGTTLPLAILDLGGGSTDAALIEENGTVRLTHKAGAGEMVSMLIQTELGLKSRKTAEEIKKYPLAKVESLFHVRLEGGAMEFFEEAMEPGIFGCVVLMKPDGFVKIEEEIAMERIVRTRRDAKRKVFVTNAIRALKEVAPGQDLRQIPNVVLVGGSAEDFELPEMLMEEFAAYKIVCGRGNIRKTEGPRNAVATGLVLSYLGEQK